MYFQRCHSKFLPPYGHMLTKREKIVKNKNLKNIKNKMVWIYGGQVVFSQNLALICLTFLRNWVLRTDNRWTMDGHVTTVALLCST